MTVNTTTSRTEQLGNGTRTGYDATFTILADGDLDVYVGGTLQTISSDYTVANAGTTTPASVTFTNSSYPTPTTSLASSVDVVLVRNLELKQLSNYQNNDIFDAETLEQSLDRATQQIQQINTTNKRGIGFSDTVVNIDTTVTDLTASVDDRKNKFIGFDSAGKVTVSGDIGSYRGAWASGKTYVVKDIVKDSSNNNVYLCNDGHISEGSTPVKTNTHVAKWDLIVDAESVTTSEQTATTQATAAASSATAAAGSATTATTQATTATTQATTATTKAGEASTSATNAAASEVAAKNSAAAVASALDSFDDKYLGTMSDSSTQGTNPTPTGTWAKNSSSITVSSASNIKIGQLVTGSGIPTGANVLSIDGTTVVVSENMAAAGSSVSLTFTGYGVYGTYNDTKDGPTTDNDNGALADGMLYFNTTDNQMMVYKTTGSKWIAASSTGSTSLIVHKFTASGSETSVAAASFTPTLSYTIANIIVFLNGVRLDATDYTATNGNDITGLAALSASDEVVVYAFKSFEVADAVSAASGGTFAGNVAYTGNIQVDDIVEKTSAHGVEIDGVLLKDGGMTFTGPITGVDVNGTELILDADADTSLHASTDDQIDIKIGGTDVGNFNSDTLNLVKDGSPKLTVEDTGESAYSSSWLTYPEIVLKHSTDNANADGVLGSIQFKGTTKTDIGGTNTVGGADIVSVQGRSFGGGHQFNSSVKGGLRVIGMQGDGSSTTLLELQGKDIKIQSGGGIDFTAGNPALQNSATSSGQVLDVYEQGSWTITNTSGSGGTASLDNYTGYYTRIGNHVFCTGYIKVRSDSSTSTTFGGLPFNSANHDGARGGGSAGFNNEIATTLNIICDKNSSNFNFYSGSSIEDFSSSKEIYFTLHYIAEL